VIARTYPQFAVQMAELDWPASELRLIRAAYDLAVTLFAGAERGSGASFVDHLVGTASAAVIGGGTATVAAAGLLHAAYEQGDFGDGRPSPSRAHRQRVVDAVGSEVEDLVYRYHRLGWSPEVVRGELDRADAIADAHRTVLLLRIANQVDDTLDGGIVVSGKQTMSVHLPDVRGQVAELAERLGLGDLAVVARRELTAVPPTVPPELVLGGGGSRTRLPLSARQRWSWRLLLSTIERRLRRIAGFARRMVVARSRG
jgi:(p)ppGpp synthase/HD superfamily hydrolase